jgi:hypothetical protein
MRSTEGAARHPRHQREKYGITRSPSALNTAGDCSAIDPGDVRPLLSGLADPLNLNKAVVALITALLFGCCPSDIPRFVVAVHIYTVKRMLLGWSSSDVGQESLKAILAAPVRADGYSASAVILVRPATRAEAAVFHAGPYLVFIAAGHAVCNRVGLLKAPTRDCVAACQVARASHVTRIAALTDAPPTGQSPYGSGEFNYGQATEPSSEKILDPPRPSYWSKFREQGRISSGHWLSPLKSMSRGFRVFTRPAASLCFQGL